MTFNYWLPNSRGERVNHRTDNNSIVIIGANGSGKSKLGAWIEQQEFSLVHRIGAQRNLNFNENIALKSYTQAENLVFYGSPEVNGNKPHRWNWGQSYTTQMMNDFEDVLAALIALKNNENDIFVKACKKAEDENTLKPKTPFTSIDKLKSIWDSVFPQRKLVLDDAKFYAVYEDNNGEHTYSANQMSDGERAVLYLTSQVLCVPDNKILIIDEPELHLHRSIMNRLWKSLEECRVDCLFIYITHDTDFASRHISADKIWIKSFDGKNWELEKIEDKNLPENLLFQILGNRKDVIFVEGDNNSYDTKLYSLLYKDYYVIPCGSCTQVIMRTKAFNSSNGIHHCNVYGIIDRDYRSDYEIKKLKESKVYTLEVAEVENLFLVEELVRILIKHLAKNENEIFQRISDYVINQRFRNCLQKQILQSSVSEIKYLLSSMDISKTSDIEAQNSIDELYRSLDFNTIKSRHEINFNEILNSASYKKILQVYNEKNLASSIGRFLDISNNRYCQLVLDLMQGEKKQEIIDALKGYLPRELPLD